MKSAIRKLIEKYQNLHSSSYSAYDRGVYKEMIKDLRKLYFKELERSKK